MTGKGYFPLWPNRAIYQPTTAHTTKAAMTANATATIT